MIGIKAYEENGESGLDSTAIIVSDVQFDKLNRELTIEKSRIYFNFIIHILIIFIILVISLAETHLVVLSFFAHQLKLYLDKLCNVSTDIEATFVSHKMATSNLSATSPRASASSSSSLNEISSWFSMGQGGDQLLQHCARFLSCTTTAMRVFANCPHSLSQEADLASIFTSDFLDKLIRRLQNFFLENSAVPGMKSTSNPKQHNFVAKSDLLDEDMNDDQVDDDDNFDSETEIVVKPAPKNTKKAKEVNSTGETPLLRLKQKSDARKLLTFAVSYLRSIFLDR